ncbi:maternal effect protein staufen-like isoform X4 [Schistocerca gregaria]|uniref:maternal effect protein staufen-like isoform X4 n=1 Tax=Schistocerca gregaria TaxID=7010 RepID=UPI00211F36BC|nr:maternal effect protein staufen-like isoform X4 [Schistocerca gregaria]
MWWCSPRRLYVTRFNIMGSVPFIVAVVIGIHVKFCSSHDISHLSVDDVTSMFGDNECIEGSLIDFQAPSTMPPTAFAYEDLQAMLKKLGGRVAQEWAPSISGIYSSFLSENMPETGMYNETKTKTKSATKSTRSEYSASDFSGKTPMSVVNELSLLMKVRPEYSLIDMQGPPHERTFTVSLKFGGEEYSASGSSIKKAQQLVANKFLQHTLYQQPLQQLARKQQMRTSNIGTKTATSIVYEIAAKQKLSLTFEVESQTGPAHMPTFVTRCVLGDKISRGQANSKKLSKRAAAEKMLELVQYNESYSFLSNSMKRKSKKKRRSSQKKRRTRSILSTFEQMNPSFRADKTIAAVMNSEFWDVSSDNNKGLNQRLAAFAKQLVKSGSSFLDEPTVKSTLTDTTSSTFSPKSQTSQDQKVTAKHTLMQAADLLDFKVHFVDLPKPNDEFLSLVSLATNQPSLCLGVGSTVDASQEQAALRALKALWKLDVEQISSNSAPNKTMGWGDWFQWSEEMVQSARNAFHIK